MGAKLWTGTLEEHAGARLLEIAARMTREGQMAGIDLAAEVVDGDVGDTTEERFRELVNRYTHAPPDEIDREVRRVRARADGREVETVEVFWRVKLASGAYADTDPDNDSSTADAKTSTTHFEQRFQADIEKKGWPPSKGARVVRVTLTRRRILCAEKA